MNSPTESARSILLPTDGEPFAFGDVGGYFKIAGAATSGRFAVAEFPAIAPRVLAAPPHRHHNEDEFTFVVSGTLGVMLGDEVLTAGSRTWIIKPRGVWHTFWTAGKEDCHIIEIVSPAGFETYFREVAQAQDVIPRGDHIGPRAEDQVNMIGQHRETQQVDGKPGCQVFQLILDPLFAMVVVFAGEWIVTQQKAPPDDAIHDVHNRDLIRRKQLRASHTSHGPPPQQVPQTNPSAYQLHLSGPTSCRQAEPPEKQLCPQRPCSARRLCGTANSHAPAKRCF